MEESLREKKKNTRMSWFGDGDKNSKFFHTIVKCKSRFANINHIQNVQDVIIDPDKINEHILQYCSSLFISNSKWFCGEDSLYCYWCWKWEASYHSFPWWNQSCTRVLEGYFSKNIGMLYTKRLLRQFTIFFFENWVILDINSNVISLVSKMDNLAFFSYYKLIT